MVSVYVPIMPETDCGLKRYWYKLRWRKRDIFGILTPTRHIFECITEVTNSY